MNNKSLHVFMILNLLHLIKKIEEAQSFFSSPIFSPIAVNLYSLLAAGSQPHKYWLQLN